MQRSDITGIIMPQNWIADGKVVRLAIYTGTKIKLDGVEYVFMREDDIMSIVE
jgi:co-chaperonin GroES (HSP10)